MKDLLKKRSTTPSTAIIAGLPRVPCVYGLFYVDDATQIYHPRMTSAT
jgi:hypothetical protein